MLIYGKNTIRALPSISSVLFHLSHFSKKNKVADDKYSRTDIYKTLIIARYPLLPFVGDT